MAPGKIAAIGLFLVGLVPSVVVAQETDGIAGRVRDSQGLAVPGAVVRVVNEATTATVEAVTDAQGAYRAPGLAPGRYRLDVNSTASSQPCAAWRSTQLQAPRRSTWCSSPRDSPPRSSSPRGASRRRRRRCRSRVSVVSGTLAADTGAFNVNRLKELIPTVQFYSSNPRNSAINIRGLGSPFGLTNDGIEVGVGLYIDGAFMARPAAATLDFLDVERIEVLRGPQGTLFGKNTTAGAINVTTRKPTFTPETDVEINYGSLGLVQAKASVSGPLLKNVAGRFSFSGTTRDGTLEDVAHRRRSERPQQPRISRPGAVRASRRTRP